MNFWNVRDPQSFINYNIRSDGVPISLSIDFLSTVTVERMPDEKEMRQTVVCTQRNAILFLPLEIVSR